MAGPLTMLGQAIAEGGRNFANRQIQLQDEERARQQQLADRADARAYAEQRFNVERGARNEDADLAMKRAMLQVLVQHGYLSPEQMNDPQAAEAAYTQAKQDGLVQRYQKLIADGYLRADEVGNPEAVTAALNKWSERGGEMISETDKARANASVEATRLRDEGIQTQQQLDTLQTELNRPPAQASAEQIQQRAIQLAMQAKGGKGQPSIAEIQAQVEPARQQIEEMLTTNALLRKQTINQQIQSLRMQLQYNQQRQSNLEDKFGVAPGAIQAPPPTAAVNPLAEPRPPSGADRAQAMQQVLASLGKSSPTGAADATIPSQFQPLPGEQNDPMIAEENARRRAKYQQITFSDPMAETQAQIQAIDKQIEKLRMPGPSMLTPTGPWMVDTTVQQRPQKAAELASLFQQREALQKNAAQLAARLREPVMTPLAPTISRPMAVSNDVFTTNPRAFNISPIDMAPAF